MKRGYLTQRLAKPLMSFISKVLQRTLIWRKATDMVIQKNWMLISLKQKKSIVMKETLTRWMKQLFMACIQNRIERRFSNRVRYFDRQFFILHP